MCKAQSFDSLLESLVSEVALEGGDPSVGSIYFLADALNGCSAL